MSKTFHRKLLTITLAAVVTTALLPVGRGNADVVPAGDSGNSQRLTEDQILNLPVDEQARIFAPLRAAASALSQIGEEKYADSYSGVTIDAPNDLVHVYATGLASSEAIIVEAGRTYPQINLDVAVAERGKYSRRQLQGAAERLLKQRTGADRVHTISVPPDGSGLKVGVGDFDAIQGVVASDSPARSTSRKQLDDRRARLANLGGIDVILRQGDEVKPVDRYGDTPAFYSGAFVTNSGWNCTTGIPVKAKSGGAESMIIASHCGRTGTQWKTGRGTVVGTVSKYSTTLDASVIPTSVAPRLWDGPPGPSAQSLALQGTGVNRVGDSVCQNGYTSGVICGIRVTDDFLYQDISAGRYAAFTARGVASSKSGSTAVRGGDSGGLVYVINGSSANPRQARGLVSAGSGSYLFYVAVADILTNWSLTLATE
ncbi:hypothetical protein PSN13_04050 [Micromonospora saelicesensis]|uniref:Streptogrisin C n=1 Tax=Micromonospora saelicesensis TaxID=285676 RepID=A0A328NIQ9_9ACTN|nr:hypothetical protein [Micromonospora saelicesensis]RAO31486.1 hypothetical protein PSN13_04050 [Micromonospora saelicesensis]